MKKKNKLEEFLSNPKKAIWKLSIPMMFGMSIHALYMLADIFFITNLIDSGQEMTSGLADIFPIIFIIMGVTMGLGSGSTTVIAQNIGSGNKATAKSASAPSLMPFTSAACSDAYASYWLSRGRGRGNGVEEYRF